MKTTAVQPHIYALDRLRGGYVDLGPSTRLDRFFAHRSAGQLTTKPAAGLIIPGRQDVYEGPRSQQSKSSSE